MGAVVHAVWGQGWATAFRKQRAGVCRQARGRQGGRAPVPVGVLASAVRGSERPWRGPGKARSLGFPGAGPSLARGAPAQQLVRQPCCGSSHLALDLGLRPVGRGEDVVRAAWHGACLSPQAPAVRSSALPSGQHRAS